MTKCRNRGEAFIFTVPDRSPLRNCTYLRRAASSGLLHTSQAQVGPEGNEETRLHFRERTHPNRSQQGGWTHPRPRPTLCRAWPSPQPTGRLWAFHADVANDLEAQPRVLPEREPSHAAPLAPHPECRWHRFCPWNPQPGRAGPRGWHGLPAENGKARDLPSHGRAL